MFDKMIDYLQGHSMDILGQIATHLWVSLLALLLAAIIAIPLGYLASCNKSHEKWFVGPFQILRVVPSLAILVLLIPILGTGVVPAVVALTILAIPPIILNTIVGFDQVPDFMLECAKGIGLDSRQELWKVNVPLALPLIFAGLRTGLVEVIASATLAAKIGAGGLGEIIFTGLGLNRMDLLLIGGVAVAVLSLGCGALFDRITALVLRYKNVF